MTLPDLKHLDKIIALCRKRGVKCIKIDNVELTLADEAPESTYKQKKAAKAFTQPVDSPFETDTPSEEDLLFWSALGEPYDPAKAQ